MMFYLTKSLKFPANMARHCSSKITPNSSSIKYCADIVRNVFWYFAFITDRQYDYENFLATLLMTNIVRSPALVIRAFNVEIARIQDQTNDSKIATMRFQFWHDTLKHIFNKKSTLRDIPANPVAQEMFKISSSHKLPKRYLEKLITSRNQIINAKYFFNMEDIEKYSEDSVSSLYYTLLSIAGVQNVHADHVASHLGKAQGITNILRSIHVCNQHRSIMLPMDILMKNKVSQENVLRGVDNEAMQNVAYEIASRAHSHLEKARKIEIPSSIKQIFLPASSVERYLTKLQKKNFNVFDPDLQKSSVLLPVNLYLNRLFNKF